MTLAFFTKYFLIYWWKTLYRLGNIIVIIMECWGLISHTNLFSQRKRSVDGEKGMLLSFGNAACKSSFEWQSLCVTWTTQSICVGKWISFKVGGSGNAICKETHSMYWKSSDPPVISLPGTLIFLLLYFLSWRIQKCSAKYRLHPERCWEPVLPNDLDFICGELVSIIINIKSPLEAFHKSKG